MIRTPPRTEMPRDMRYVLRTPNLSYKVPDAMYATISLQAESIPVKYTYSNIVVKKVSSM